MVNVVLYLVWSTGFAGSLERVGRNNQFVWVTFVFGFGFGK